MSMRGRIPESTWLHYLVVGGVALALFLGGGCTVLGDGDEWDVPAVSRQSDSVHFVLELASVPETAMPIGVTTRRLPVRNEGLKTSLVNALESNAEFGRLDEFFVNQGYSQGNTRNDQIVAVDANGETLVGYSYRTTKSEGQVSSTALIVVLYGAVDLNGDPDARPRYIYMTEYGMSYSGSVVYWPQGGDIYGYTIPMER